jgi:hypothetical protein
MAASQTEEQRKPGKVYPIDSEREMKKAGIVI